MNLFTNKLYASPEILGSSEVTWWRYHFNKINKFKQNHFNLVAS